MNYKVSQLVRTLRLSPLTALRVVKAENEEVLHDLHLQRIKVVASVKTDEKEVQLK